MSALTLVYQHVDRPPVDTKELHFPSQWPTGCSTAKNQFLQPCARFLLLTLHETGLLCPALMTGDTASEHVSVWIAFTNNEGKAVSRALRFCHLVPVKYLVKVLPRPLHLFRSDLFQPITSGCYQQQSWKCRLGYNCVLLSTKKWH